MSWEEKVEMYRGWCRWSCQAGGEERDQRIFVDVVKEDIEIVGVKEEEDVYCHILP